MSDLSHIDEAFREHKNDLEGQPEDAAWDRISDQLDEHQSGIRRRRRAIYRFSAAASVAALMSISIYMFNNSFQANSSLAKQTDIEIPDHKGDRSQPTLNDGVDEASIQAITPAISVATENGAGETKNATALRNTTSTKALEKNTSTAKDPASTSFSYSNDVPQNIQAKATEKTNDTDDNLSQLQDQSSFNLAVLDEVVVADGDEEQVKSGSAKQTFKQEEPAMLTETAVANSEGIQAAKARQQQKEKQARSKATKESYAPQEAIGGMVAADRTESFTSTMIIVLIPWENEGSCRYLALQLEEDRYYIDRCQNDRFDLLQTESQPIGRSAVLTDLWNLDREYLQGLANQAADGPCLSSSTDMVMIHRTGTSLSYHDETIRFPMREFCLPEEAKKLVEQLKEMRKRMGQ